MTGSRFVPYGPDHLAVLALVGLVAAGLIAFREPLRRRPDVWIRRGLAAVLVADGVVSWGAEWMRFGFRLPFDLCDVSLVVMAVALAVPWPRLCVVAYFWGLGGLFALATPALLAAFPRFWWFSFFIGHGATVLGAVWLAASGRVRPGLRAIWGMCLLTNLYVVAAVLLNLATGTNYGFLASKPAQPTMLDWFGPWPWYILGMEAAGLASLFLFALPFLIGGSRKLGTGTAPLR